MNPAPDDLYSKVIEIAQEQAEASSAMTELHRQNVTKMDTMTTLLSAQTTTLTGLNTALAQMNRDQDKVALELLRVREQDVRELKDHINQEFRLRFSALEFWRKPAFWLAVALLALSNIADILPKVVGLFKP